MRLIRSGVISFKRCIRASAIAREASGVLIPPKMFSDIKAEKEFFSNLDTNTING